MLDEIQKNNPGLCWLSGELDDSFYMSGFKFKIEGNPHFKNKTLSVDRVFRSSLRNEKLWEVSYKEPYCINRSRFLVSERSSIDFILNGVWVLV